MTHRFRAYLSFPHIIMNELSLCSGILIDFSIPLLDHNLPFSSEEFLLYYIIFA